MDIWKEIIRIWSSHIMVWQLLKIHKTFIRFFPLFFSSFFSKKETEENLWWHFIIIHWNMAFYMYHHVTIHWNTFKLSIEHHSIHVYLIHWRQRKKVRRSMFTFSIFHMYFCSHTFIILFFFICGDISKFNERLIYLFDTRIHISLCITWQIQKNWRKEKNERKNERFLVVFRHVFPEFLMNQILIWSLVYRSRFKYAWFDWNINTQQSIDATPTFSFASICTAIAIINNRYIQ